MARDSAKALADQILWEHKVSKLTLDNLLYFLEEQGYEVIDYSRSDNSSSTASLLERTGTIHVAESNSAFLFSSGDQRLVFIDEELQESEKLYALAHELGHICCGHVSSSTYIHGSFEQEHQANEFAHYLLHPSIKHCFRSWISENKLLTAVIAVVLILGIVSIPIVTYYQSKIYHDYYFITDGGEHYHLEDCYYIKGKSAHRMTKEEFESGKYSPCKICFH